jgi:hypothetical protein
MFPSYKGKRKPKNKKNSYRGITLMPVLNKLFESAVWERVKPWLLTQNIPHELQLAGRSGGSALDVSLCAQEAIHYHIERGSKVFACFLDVESAFDKVWWDCLFYKLYQLDIKHKMWFLIKEMFASSSAVILLNGQVSESFPVTRGIKQGGILSMFFFTVSIIDIHSEADKYNDGLHLYDLPIGTLAYADDILLLSNTKNGLDRMMYQTNIYGKKWNIVFSHSKTVCMVFGEGKRNKRKNKRSWKLGDKSITECNSTKHLGITLTSDMSSALRIKEACNKGKGIYFSLMQAGVKPNAINPIISANVRKKVGEPAMLYGC